MKAAYPFIDDFLPAGTLASLERLGQVLAGRLAGDGAQGLGGHARDHGIAVARARGARRGAAAGARRGRRPARPGAAAGLGEETTVRELLDQLDAWTADGAGVGRAVVVRTFGSAPRPEGGVLLVSDDGRLAGSVSGRLRRGRRGGGDPRARAKAGRQRVIRYGISDEQAWDVGLACGGTIDVLVQPAVPAEAVAAARDTRDGRGGGRAIVTLLPADAPPPAFGAHAPGSGEAPGAAAGRPRRRAPRRHAGRPGCGRGARPIGARPARPRRLEDGRGRRAAGLRRGVPGPAAAGGRRRGRGRAHARPAGP